jgi:hypothetical protein
MLKRIVDVIGASNFYIKSGTLFCNNHVITDPDCIEYLEENSFLEELIDNKRVGEVINLELSLIHLNSIHFFEDCDAFISKNKYVTPTGLYYIKDLNCYSDTNHDFIILHKSVVNFVLSIKQIAKHTYLDLNIDNIILFREDKSSVLPIIYDASNIRSMKIEDIDKLNSIATAFEEGDTEKKFLYINELIELLNSQREDERFTFILSNFNHFYNKCVNAYQFYLRDFSSNKLKIELDSKALEYTQKIQSVINDAQTKLIAIPTAFVLVFSTIDFTQIVSIKNVSIVLSLVIFSLLIQLFLNNQKSTLNFIWDNITSYKETFKDSDIEKISSKFLLVERELKKQKYRLRITEVILWLIPILLLCLCLVLALNKIILLVAFLMFMAILISGKYLLNGEV